MITTQALDGRLLIVEAHDGHVDLTIYRGPANPDSDPLHLPIEEASDLLVALAGAVHSARHHDAREALAAA